MNLVPRRYKTDSDEKPKSVDQLAHQSGGNMPKLSSKPNLKQVQKLIPELTLRCQELGKLLLQSDRDSLYWKNTNRLIDLLVKEVVLEKDVFKTFHKIDLNRNNDDELAKTSPEATINTSVLGDQKIESLRKELESVRVEIEAVESNLRSEPLIISGEKDKKTDEIQEKVSELNVLIEDIELQDDFSSYFNDDGKAETVLLSLVQEIPKLALALRDKENETFKGRELTINNHDSLRKELIGFIDLINAKSHQMLFESPEQLEIKDVKIDSEEKIIGLSGKYPSEIDDLNITNKVISDILCISIDLFSLQEQVFKQSMNVRSKGITENRLNEPTTDFNSVLRTVVDQVQPLKDRLASSVSSIQLAAAGEKVINSSTQVVQLQEKVSQLLNDFEEQLKSGVLSNQDFNDPTTKERPSRPSLSRIDSCLDAQ